MKTMYVISLTVFLVVSFGACKQRSASQAQKDIVIETVDNSRISLDWQGVYKGMIPCADCEGINVHITLNADETYQISYQYIGKGDGVPQIASGKFTWSDNDGIITFKEDSFPPYYRVGENTLIQLDMNKNLITGNLAEMYVLKKQ